MLSLQQESSLTKDFILDVVYKLYLLRFTDEKMSRLAKQNHGGNFHISTMGHELAGLLFGEMLQKQQDWGFAYYRDRAFALGKGAGLQEIFEVFLARNSAHHGGGRMMPDHFCQRDCKLALQSSVVGSQFLQAVGTALSIKWKKTGEVVYVSAGEGGTSQGDYHEALNFAAIHKLPIVFVIQDNGYAISVTKQEQTAGGSVEKISSGYENITVFSVKGTDLLSLYSTYEKAIHRARNLEGPSVVVVHVRRIGAHSSSDDPGKYKSQEMMEEEKAWDPLLLVTQWAKQEGIVCEQKLDHLQAKAEIAVEEAAEKALLCSHPDPETALDHLFAPVNIDFSHQQETDVESVMVDSINHALIEEMERDSRVVVFGQDVAGGKGGVFTVTKSLTERFGLRCFNTPLAESTIIGISLGLALEGTFKPVAEIQFADYIWTGINQLINEIGSARYRSNGAIESSLVIRVPCGGYIQGGPYHSQSIEAFLAHAPGLKVVYPSNSFDAKALLKSAIRDPNPVVFLEHKALYRKRGYALQYEGDQDTLLEIGKAKRVLEGDDITIVSWGMMVHFAYEIIHQEELSVDLIDLRTIKPLDIETIVSSVQKTGKLLLLQEAPRTCGFAAEIAAQISELAFSYLDAPILRVAGEDVVVPFSKVLEERVLPSKEKIKEQIYYLLNF